MTQLITIKISKVFEFIIQPNTLVSRFDFEMWVYRKYRQVVKNNTKWKGQKRRW